MKKCYLLISLILLLITIDAEIEGKDKTIAIFDLSPNGVASTTALGLSDILRTEIINMHFFKVIERQNIEQILNEQGFSITGAVSSEKSIELGQLLSAAYILTGSINKIGNSYYINARIINTETGEADIADYISAKDEESLVFAVRQFIEKIKYKLGIEKKQKKNYIEKTSIELTEQAPVYSTSNLKFLYNEKLPGKTYSKIYNKLKLSLKFKSEKSAYNLIDVAINKEYSLVFLALDNKTIYGLDISELSNIYIVYKLKNIYLTRALSTYQKFLYTVNEENIMNIYDLSSTDPNVYSMGPELKYKTPHIYITGKNLYTAEIKKGIEIFSLAIPDIPEKIGSFSTSGYIFDITGKNDMLVVAADKMGIITLKLNEKNRLDIIKNIETDFKVRRVFLIDEMLYIPYKNTIYVYDLKGKNKYIYYAKSTIRDIIKISNRLYIAEDDGMECTILKKNNLKYSNIFKAKDIKRLFQRGKYLIAISNNFLYIFKIQD